MDLREVHPADERVERPSDLEVRFVLRATFAPCLRQRDGRGLTSVVERPQAALDFTVAFFDLEGVEVVQLNGLTEGEDVLVAVVSGQRLSNCFDRSLASDVAELGEGSVDGVRSPSRIARMILMPVIPVTSLTT